MFRVLDILADDIRCHFEVSLLLALHSTPAAPQRPAHLLLVEGGRGTFREVFSNPVDEELFGGFSRPLFARILKVALVERCLLFLL